MKKVFLAFAASLVLKAPMNAQMSSLSQNNPVTDKRDLSNVNNGLGTESKHFTSQAGGGKLVSDQTKLSFAGDFGNAPVLQWTRVDNLDEVTFLDNGVTKTAFYDNDAQLVGTTTAEMFSDLPVKAQNEIEKHYGDYTPDQVILYDDNESNDAGMTLYGSLFNDSDSYFVEMTKDNERVVLQVYPSGDVQFFKRLN